MNELKRILECTDDEYLIGLSNKGIVKRAYKDLEAGAVEVHWEESEALVTVGDETCRIRVPLGESTCTCPSRSICKHIIQAILAVKAGLNEKGKEEPEAEREEIPAAAETLLKEEIERCLLKTLVKTMGGRSRRNLAAQLKNGTMPLISRSATVITVTYADTGILVKLIAPLSYSTCSCHKKELCEHKAEAILWCQEMLGIRTRQEILQELELGQGPDYDLEQIHEFANQMKECVRGMLDTGLARISPDCLETIERMAVTGHQAGLSKAEQEFRRLGEVYGRYFSRQASFEPEKLMLHLMYLYKMAVLLERAETSGEAAGYAGEFKSDYMPVGQLKLIGVGADHFKSDTGYEGDICYFLEEHTGTWYTYTHARPVFYDQNKKMGKGGAVRAPWGIIVSLEELSESRVTLSHAKVNRQNRISSSGATTAEITGRNALTYGDVKAVYYRDFETLFTDVIRTGCSWAEQLAGTAPRNENSRLVFIQAFQSGEPEFDRIGQVFRLSLYDERNRELVLELRYTREDHYHISYLERVMRRVRTGSGELPCFMGNVYLEDGLMKLYPILCLERKEIADVPV